MIYQAISYYGIDRLTVQNIYVNIWSKIIDETWSNSLLGFITLVPTAESIVESKVAKQGKIKAKEIKSVKMIDFFENAKMSTVRPR